MCRILALHANRPTQVGSSLWSAAHSLAKQSGCDREGTCHESGWGIGCYQDGRPQCQRSVRPAFDDPLYRSTAEAVRSTTLVAHVRKASVGSVAIRNNHPFTYANWLFAHNGTVAGFAAARQQVLSEIPAHLRQAIAGDTDSEHAFYLILALLERMAGNLNQSAAPKMMRQALVDTLRWLQALCPGDEKDPSQFNFILTDGQTLVASRWGHSLHYLERRGINSSAEDLPSEKAADYRALLVASEPTSTEGWRELPDHSVLLIDPNLDYEISALT
jgi:glutamine amidotransferase